VRPTSPKLTQPLGTDGFFPGGIERRTTPRIHLLCCLATDAAAETYVLNRRTRDDAGASGTTQHNGEPSAAAWHFMVIQVQAVHASSLTPEVAVQRADFDHLSAADCQVFSLGAGAAETKGTFTFQCGAFQVWHEDRQSNAPHERRDPPRLRLALYSWRGRSMR